MLGAVLRLLEPVPREVFVSDWSAVGRKSRRKGKRFEQEVARFMTSVTGMEFTSTRNSGRTDLKGDVYAISDPYRFVVECKDRRMTVKSLMLGLSWLDQAIEKARTEAQQTRAVHCYLFVKAEGVTFVYGDCRALKLPENPCGVTDVRGRTWRRVVLGGP